MSISITRAVPALGMVFDPLALGPHDQAMDCRGLFAWCECAMTSLPPRPPTWSSKKTMTGVRRQLQNSDAAVQRQARRLSAGRCRFACARAAALRHPDATSPVSPFRFSDRRLHETELDIRSLAGRSCSTPMPVIPPPQIPHDFACNTGAWSESDLCAMA